MRLAVLKDSEGMASVFKHITIAKYINLRIKPSPGWRGSVGWESSHQAKGHWFDSWSGHTCLGCGFGPQLGCKWEAADWCFFLTSMFLSLLFSLLSLLSKKLINLKPISYTFWDGSHHLCEKMNITNQAQYTCRRENSDGPAALKLPSKFKRLWSHQFNHRSILLKSGLPKRNVLSATHDPNPSAWDGF